MGSRWLVGILAYPITPPNPITLSWLAAEMQRSKTRARVPGPLFAERMTNSYSFAECAPSVANFLLPEEREAAKQSARDLCIPGLDTAADKVFEVEVSEDAFGWFKGSGLARATPSVLASLDQDTKTPGLRFVWSFDGMTFSNAFARTRSIAVKMGIQDRPWASKVWTGILDPSYVGHVVEIQEHDQPGFCFISFFNDKADWSRETFGPGDRYSGVIEHIRRELKEIEANPSDLTEWVDVIFLAMDGAWRSAGADGEAIVLKMLEKHKINRERRWPDWRSLGADGVSEHVKDEE